MVIWYREKKQEVYQVLEKNLRCKNLLFYKKKNGHKMNKIVFLFLSIWRTEHEKKNKFVMNFYPLENIFDNVIYIYKEMD
jgi:hypothetical protein